MLTTTKRSKSYQRRMPYSYKHKHISLAKAEDGIPYKGLGIGYGDGTVDNERLGMRTFSYFTNGAAGWGTDPASATT